MQDNPNPYDAPRSEARLADRLAPLKTASRLRRLSNYLIDALACNVLMALLMAGYVVIGGEAAAAALKERDLLQSLVLSLLMLFAYYVPLEGMFGATLGKLVTGTRVVDEQGRPPSWGQVLGRTAARLLPFEGFSLLFAPDDRIAAWHDRLPKTLVVQVR